jgi:hypothetical protein
MSRGFQRLAISMALVIGALIAAALLWIASRPQGATVPAGPAGSLHSVMLTNGQVYYGKLEEAGRGYVTLTDVYYVTVLTDPQGNRQNRLLSRQRADWHAPLKMIIPLEKVVMLEQVGPDSTVARGIEQERRNPQASPTPTPPQTPPPGTVAPGQPQQ